MPYRIVKLVVDPSVRDLCTRKYPGHPHGCPNYGLRSTCPPRAQMIGDAIYIDKAVYVIYTSFDLAAHMARMWAHHPNWSDRQARCCLYWQPQARKNLIREIQAFYQSLTPQMYSAYSVHACPEAMGVNVTETMKNAGVVLEWPPQTVTYQVAIAGVRCV